ncbi:hypothetical protein KY338_03870 [Candidatus Woesearchaeota archaeon]|nr:hypothetical protein [Candidatus Woesearchaeota archaeon]MBW3005450.1 hypothetical protein [Candidatus Woesearchaeota archaeon]
MVGEAQKRETAAGRINKQIKKLAEGVLVVGSVAHSPSKVTKKSDLDMVVVLDFRRVDFGKFYDAIGQRYDPLAVSYAVNKQVSNYSIIWHEDFEISLHIWDVDGFNAVVNTYEDQRRFTKDGQKPGSAGSPVEPMYSLTGLELLVEKPHKDVPGGRILELYPFFEEDGELYLGIPANNLLTEPKILSERRGFISSGIAFLKKRLTDRVRRLYGSFEDLSLYKAQAPKVQKKMAPELKEKLENFFE